MISHAELLRLLHYNPATGVFTRYGVANGNGRGKRPFARRADRLKDDSEYRRVFVAGRDYSAGRLAFFYMTGHWPTLEIDHIDGCKSNNAWVNLREITRQHNQQNQRRAYRSNKSSGLLGVRRNGRGWAARISVDGKQISLGTFPTPGIAHAAYIDAKRSLHEGNTL